MGKFIRLHVNRDDDGSGQLFLEFKSGGFSGVGSAYFDLSALAERVKEFEAYPLPAQPVSIAGGFLDKSNLSRVREEHLHVSAYPFGPSGRLGLLVKVAEPVDDGRRDVLRRSASAEFVTDYEQLSLFARELIELLNGLREELTLEFIE